MAYRGAFFIQVFGMMLNNLMLLFFWKMLFTRFPTLNGWELQDVVTLYAVVAAGFGLAGIVCGNAGNVARTITTGDLDYYLALPADPLLHLLVSRMAITDWGDLMFGLLLYFITVPLAWRRVPLFLLLTVLIAVIFVAFSVVVGSLTFWLGRADQLAFRLRIALLNFSLYPIDIFPGAARLLLYTLIPSAFVGSVPAQLLHRFDLGSLLGLVGCALAFSLLARWIFYRGLRRYASGNLVTVRG
jgi:ABC-2 type transport system permease protein